MRRTGSAVIQSRKRAYTWLFSMPVLLLMSALLVACANQDTSREDAAGAITVADILADPVQYRGQQITLSGEISSVLSSRVFRIKETDGLFDTNSANDGLLIAIPEDAERPMDISDEMQVEVTGELWTYEADALDPSIGVGFIPAVEGISEGDPMLLVERVAILATISALDADPGAYLHNQVTVAGRVEEVLQEGIVRLVDPETGGDVLVVIADAGSASLVQEGQQLVVTGLVRQFNLEEIGGEFALNLESGIFANWENRAVIIADFISE
jgi:hypothetical protein